LLENHCDNNIDQVPGLRGVCPDGEPGEKGNAQAICALHSQPGEEMCADLVQGEPIEGCVGGPSLKKGGQDLDL